MYHLKKKGLFPASRVLCLLYGINVEHCVVCVLKTLYIYMCSHCSAVAFSFRVLIQGGSGGIGTFAVQVTDGPLHLEMTSDMSEKLITHNKAFLTALVHQ